MSTPGRDLADAERRRRAGDRDTQRLGYVLNLKLADPASAQAFENGSAATAFGNGTGNDTASFLLTSWQDIQHSDFKVVAVDQKVLLIVSSLLALLAIASIAVVVGEPDGRADPARRAAQGGRWHARCWSRSCCSPRTSLLALAAAAVGVTVGPARRAAAHRSSATGCSEARRRRRSPVASVAEVALVAVAVAAGATIVPAIRGARTSTIRALNDPATRPGAGRG